MHVDNVSFLCRYSYITFKSVSLRDTPLLRHGESNKEGEMIRKPAVSLSNPPRQIYSPDKRTHRARRELTTLVTDALHHAHFIIVSLGQNQNNLFH